MVQLRTERGQPAGRLREKRREAVDEVHPAHRPFTDPAGRDDADDRRRQDRRGRRQCRALGRAGRRRPGDRSRSSPNASKSLQTLLEPGRAVQFNSLFLDPYLWKLQVGGKRLVQKARQSGRTDRRCRRLRRNPRPGRGRRTHRRAEWRRHHPRRVQARHGRADPLGDPHRRRGAHQAGDRPHRGRSRRRSPLLGGPRRPSSGHLLGAAGATQHHGLRRRRHRHTRAGRGVPDRYVGGARTATR